MWRIPARRLGLWTALVVIAQAGGEAVHKTTFDVPPGIAAIVVGVVAAVVALIGQFRKSKPNDEMTRLLAEALLASLRRQEADADGDEPTKEEQTELIRHTRAELERRHRGRGVK